MSIYGNPSNLIHFTWDRSYKDLIDRFEDEVNIKQITTNTDLHTELREWMGIGKKKLRLPRQGQMDFFSEYYDTSRYYVKKEEIHYLFTYRKTGSYNRNSGMFARSRDMKIFDVEEILYKFKYGHRIVLRDIKTKRILAHHKDVETNEYLTDWYE